MTNLLDIIKIRQIRRYMAKTKHKNYFIIFWTVIRLLTHTALVALFGYLINMLFDAVDGDILERMKV